MREEARGEGRDVVKGLREEVAREPVSRSAAGDDPTCKEWEWNYGLWEGDTQFFLTKLSVMNMHTTYPTCPL